jgi:hypothetical protein
MNTIATINDILLPVVLFVTYFCFVSVLRYNLKETTDVSTDQEVTISSEQTSEEKPKSFTYREAFLAAFDPEPISEMTEEIVASVEPENVEETVALISPEMTNSEPIDARLATYS